MIQMQISKTICKVAISLNIYLKCFVYIECDVDFLLYHIPYVPKFKWMEFTYNNPIHHNLMNSWDNTDDM
jgi:hypothetical protein